MSEINVGEILSSNDELVRKIAAEKQVPHTISDQDMLLDFLVRSVFPQDHTLAIKAYFDGGEDCAKRFAALVADHSPKANSILEFASGYGRVARYAKHVMPQMEWVSSDIHSEAVDFLKQKIGISSFPSAHSPSEWQPDRTFDVVFALSFFSHMPDSTFMAWIDKLLASVVPEGLLIFTTHGADSIRMMKTGGMDAAFDDHGYFWYPHSDQRDLESSEYGTSAVSLGYVTEVISQIDSAEMVRFQQGFWWNHQDLYIVKKTEPVPTRRQFAAPQKRRLPPMEVA